MEQELLNFTKWLSESTHISDPKGLVKMYLKAQSKAENLPISDVRLSLQLLKVAKCPNCDGSEGVKTWDEDKEKSEVFKCGWCNERNKLTSNEA